MCDLYLEMYIGVSCMYRIVCETGSASEKYLPLAFYFDCDVKGFEESSSSS